MDYKDLTALLLKLVAACLMFWYISWTAPAIISVVQSGVTARALVLYLMPPLILLAFSILLFLFPATITNKLIRGEKLETSAEFRASLEVLAIRVIGLLFLFRGSVDLVFHLASMYFLGPFNKAAGISGPTPLWNPEMAANIAATIVELCLAAWFAFGAQGISGAIHRQRGKHDDH